MPVTNDAACFRGWREPMRVQRSLICFGSLHRTALALMIAFAFVGTGLGARAQESQASKPAVAIQFAFDRPLDASMAPFVLAGSHGLFNAEGVAVTTATAKGTADAIARVASGESDLAVADINELIRFRDELGKPPVKAVFVLFNQAPY